MPAQPPQRQQRQPLAPPPQSSQFVDPAIVGFSKPARPPRAQPGQPPTPVSPVMIANGAVQSPPPAPPAQNLRGQSSISSIATARKADRRDSTATATLTEPFDAMALKTKEGQEKSRPDKKKSQTAPGIIDMRDINHGPLKSKKQNQAQTQSQPGKGKGWRNTPLIEEKPTRPTRKQRGRPSAQDDPNGWATEEVTDIAEMGDFDFATSNSKFDKRKVFDDIRRDDTTADEDRLVSHNRLPKARPGTNGGRNLHFSENVLDGPETNDASRWKSEAGETEDDELKEGHYSSGRNSRRAGSRRPLQSRKASTVPLAFDRKDPSPSRQLSRMPTASPLNGTMAAENRATFRIASTNKPCHTISPLQMLELEQLCIAELGMTEDMLSENAGRSIAEAILHPPSPQSQLFSHTPLTSISSTPPDPPRSVLFLLGNHKSAARTLVAARHLRNRRLRVTVCMLGLNRAGDEEHLYEVVRKQLNIYRANGGTVERWEDYLAKLNTPSTSSQNGIDKANHSITSTTIPDVVVDCLLGYHLTFDDLRGEELAGVFSMVKWVNLQAAHFPPMHTSSHLHHPPSVAQALSGATSQTLTSASQPEKSFVVISIDIPTGLSATTGVPSTIDSQPLFMHATQILSLGAPKTGLLAAVSTAATAATPTGIEDVSSASSSARNWTVRVVDVGIGGTVWNKLGGGLGTRRGGKGVDFGNDWIVGVKLS